MSNTSNFGTELLPERPAVLKAWEGFRSTYPAYLEPSNRAAWLMQDKIVNDYATGVLMSEAEWRIGQGTEPLYRFIDGKANNDCGGTCPLDVWSDHRCMERVWPKEAADVDA